MRLIRHLRPNHRNRAWILAALIVLSLDSARAQQNPVTGQVEVLEAGAKNQADAPNDPKAAPNAVVWLVPSPDDPSSPGSQRAHSSAQLVQRNKSFEPHVLVVEVGTVVQFPNKDPFFHNVFSLFDGKRFDLGLYEAGSSNSVRFERPGISFIFCNIHPEMSAVIIAVPTPFYAVSDAAGRWTMANVPDGRYQFHVWYERSSTDSLAKLQRDLVISDSHRALESIRVTSDAAPTSAHKNKYGKDYVPASSPAYSNP
jgi:plastocyanin